ncbi:MAG TPA: glycosyltransferase [Bryobacteraceae bacterium]|nr:glycosyltransferase [Bryobacteraceae bacterium]
MNGVALTSRQFDAYAKRNGLPFLSVHAGPETVWPSGTGDHQTIELARGPLAFGLEKDLFFDPALWRYQSQVVEIVKAFQPDLIHVTGPGDFGLLAVWIAHQHGIPFAASWHTNVHEYAGRRLENLLSFLPPRPLGVMADTAERFSLTGTALFYKIGKVLFAPNQELVDLLIELTGKPVFLMQRGVDAELYSPSRRDSTDNRFTIGYVGRLSPEKNVRLLATVEKILLTAGHTDYRFLIVGHGNELEWLQQNLRQAEFTGVLKGEALARAYANMDIFAFPSTTDTFGNVILEALASGTPSVVTTGGGPKFLVQHGVTGYIAATEHEFASSVLHPMGDRELHARMRLAARQYACSISWDKVFEGVYEAYNSVLFNGRFETPATTTTSST